MALPSAGENDVTIILKPFPGAKRWQHLQRQQGPAGGEQFAVEANYTVILGSHRNSKLKIEKNGEEKAVVSNWVWLEEQRVKDWECHCCTECKW